MEPPVTLQPVELAGRGKRFQEPLYQNVNSAVDDVFHLIKGEIATMPYAFLGHSMGSMIAYELTRKIRAHQLPLPLHLFISGRRPPHLEKPGRKKYHLMNDADFRKEVISLGGTPPDFFDHPELLELFLPVLKNDFKLAEEDRHEGTIHTVDVDITVLSGKADDLASAECDKWKLYTTRQCVTHYFEGGHFFLHDHAAAIAGIINTTLKAPVY